MSFNKLSQGFAVLTLSLLTALCTQLSASDYTQNLFADTSDGALQLSWEGHVSHRPKPDVD